MATEHVESSTDVYEHLRNQIETDVPARDGVSAEKDSWAAHLKDENQLFAEQIQSELGLTQADTIRTIVLLARAHLSESASTSSMVESPSGSESAEDASMEELRSELEDLNKRVRRIGKVVGAPKPLSSSSGDANGSSGSDSSGSSSTLDDHL